MTNLTSIRITPWPSYEYAPEEDITAYEVALILPVLVAGMTNAQVRISDLVERLPEEARRHFKEAA